MIQNNISFLIVEYDEFTFKYLFKTITREFNLKKLFIAKNEEEKFELYKKEKPDLILSDE